ncbi:hypothetical protein TorRG33x02_253570 [Trema orientale]|uniref:Uncharacterized protein n=1 Tax=Trema orientale TaxID=63057 RepID=A0A2P5DEP3_TREOI|nr:hypothetical protein TorRG33x02_253570 [Trema orientale]
MELMVEGLGVRFQLDNGQDGEPMSMIVDRRDLVGRASTIIFHHKILCRGWNLADQILFQRGGWADEVLLSLFDWSRR